MKTIYLDKDFKCHITNDGTMREIHTDSFDGKCQTFIEGYRYIPSGENWIYPDGVAFTSGMCSPWKPYNELASAQAQYEADLVAAAAAYQEGVNSAYDT